MLGRGVAARSRRCGIGVKDDPWGGSLSETAGGSRGGGWSLFGSALSAWGAVFCGPFPVRLCFGLEGFQRPGQERPALGCRELEDFGRGRLFVVNGLDLVCGQVFVKYLLQRVRICWSIVPHQAQALTHLPPHQLLVRHLVVAAMLDNVREQLAQVHRDVPHLGLRVKICAALLVKDAEFFDELLILGSAIDGMLDGGFCRGHFGASSRGTAPG